ncbi:MAG: MBL fold metallo-hydrolase [Rhodospirillaceae bacterium]
MDFSRRNLFTAGAAVLAASTLPAALPARAAAPAVGKQGPGVFRFKVGTFEVTQLNDGVVKGGPLPETFVRNASKADVEKALQAAFMPSDGWTNTFTPIVVNTGQKLVLIDTGFGNNAAPALGQLRGNMAAAGIDPKSIDTVIISHFHPDHINGIRTKEGELVYPNAEIMVPAVEWAFWMDDARMNAAPEGMKGVFNVARRVFGPIAKDVKQFEWGKELVSGIASVDAKGHTPGHSAFTVASGSETMIYVADTTNNPLIFARNPEWKLMFDMDPDQSVATRKKLLDMCAADRIQASFYHAAFPATGYITKTASGYDFTPRFWNTAL